MTAVEGQAVKYLYPDPTTGEDRVLDAVVEKVVGGGQADLLVTLDGDGNKMRRLGSTHQGETTEGVQTYVGGDEPEPGESGPAMGPVTAPVAPPVDEEEAE